MEFRCFVKSLLLPPFIQITIILAAWWMRQRRPRLAWGICLVAVLSLWVLGTPIAATFLVRTLEQHPALVPELLNAVEADAIVVLSANQIDTPAEFGQPVSGSEQLIRIRYGAFVHRRTGVPVLLSGGSVLGLERRSLAETMAYDFSEGFGIDVRWLETRSRTTMENALHSYDMLASEGKTSIILVTSAYHMIRAKWSFEQAGFKVLAAPTGFIDRASMRIISFVPQAHSLYLSGLAIHEWLGYLAYQLFKG